MSREMVVRGELGLGARRRARTRLFWFPVALYSHSTAFGEHRQKAENEAIKRDDVRVKHQMVA